MKKEYVKPEICMVKLKMASIICTSGVLHEEEEDDLIFG